MPDIYAEEELINSRAIQRVTDRHRNRVGREEIGVTLFKEYVDSIPEGKIIVIRGDGLM